MNSTIRLALVLVLVPEGLEPMLYPKTWKKMIPAMTNLPDNILRRSGGGLVVTGVVVYCTLRKAIGWTKNRLVEVILEYKKCRNSEKMMAEFIFKQTVALKNG